MKYGTPEYKAAQKIRSHRYYLNNLDKIKVRAKVYRESHKTENREYFKKVDKLPHRQEYYRKRRATPEWKAMMREYQKNWMKKKREKPEFRIECALRKRLWDAVKGNHKTDRTMSLLGCSIGRLMEYLHAHFSQGMTFNNYGSVWEIDHTIPCDAFDMSDPTHQRACFNWLNLKPMFSSENASKNNKLPNGFDLNQYVSRFA